MKRRRPPAGFTLVEVLVSFTMAAAVLAAVFSCFTYLGRSLTRLAGYQALETEARRALAHLQQDLSLAAAVKSGTATTASALTLVLPAGEVAYTFDAATGRLRRQAGFGASPDLYFLGTNHSRCTAFAFTYYTGTGGAPTDQATPSVNVPLSIKRIAFAFSLESPAGTAAEARSRYEIASARFLVRNKRPPDGT